MKIENGTGGSRETSTDGPGPRPGPSDVGERGRESINFFAELKRRNVYKVAITYAVVAWLLIQAASILLPTFEAPTWVMKAFLVFLALGFVISVMISWAFEATPQGLKRTENVPPDVAAALPTWSPRKFATFVIAVAVIAAALLAYQFLRTKSTVTPRHSEAATKSIAVLPFVNMSADKNDEYLSDGMTEELINVLAKVPGLRVPGRTSCFAFKGKNEEDIFRKVGDQLHVGTVLEGSVRKAGDKLRVTAQLIDVSDGYHLWSKDYDGDVKDILNFQSNVAEQVVQALQVQLGTEAARALTKKATENPEAHRLYLLGRYHAAKYTQADTADADRYFQQALQLDPNYALAYCGLADNYGGKGGNTMPGREAWAKQRILAQKALNLAPELAEAHLALSNVLAGTFNWADARTELNRALELNPNLAWAYDTSAWILGVFGRFDEALANEKKALELDPLNPAFSDSVGWYLYWARRYDEAIVQLRSNVELFPNDAFSYFALGCCLFKTGNLVGARAEIQKAIQLDDLPWYTGWLAYTYARSGERAKAEQILHDLDELAKKRYVTPNARVPIYLGLGDKEKTLDGLEKCYQDQDGACWWLKVDQVYDGIRDEPRFQALLKKVGLDK